MPSTCVIKQSTNSVLSLSLTSYSMENFGVFVTMLKPHDPWPLIPQNLFPSVQFIDLPFKCLNFLCRVKTQAVKTESVSTLGLYKYYQICFYSNLEDSFSTFLTFLGWVKPIHPYMDPKLVRPTPCTPPLESTWLRKKTFLPLCSTLILLQKQGKETMIWGWHKNMVDFRIWEDPWPSFVGDHSVQSD